MAIKDKDIYKGRQKSHKTAKLIIIIAVLLLAAAIGLFYLLKSWAIYDENGNATIVFPFTQKAQE